MPDKIAIEWKSEADEKAMIRVFVTALTGADDAGPILIRIARKLGLLDEIIFELGRRRMCERLGLDAEPGEPFGADAGSTPTASSTASTDPEGDPVDPAGGDGGLRKGDRVILVRAGAPPVEGDDDPLEAPDKIAPARRTCERCGHRTPADGVCRAPGGSRENERTAVGDTCRLWAPIAGPKKKIRGDVKGAPVDGFGRPRVKCRACGRICSSRTFGGERYPFAHKIEGALCDGCQEPGEAL